MRNHRAILLLAFCVVPALAQSPTQQPASNPLKPSAAACKDGDTAVPRPVQQQPYTVELKTTTVQTLANGASITRESTEIQARDSQQRTFRSYTHAPFVDHQKVFTTVNIEDPVEGTQINWNSQSDEATVLKLPPADQRGCWQSDSGHMRMNYGPAAPVSAGVGGGTGFAASSLAVTMGGNSATPGIGAGAGGSRVALSASMPSMAHTDPKIEDLGTATIEGIEVHGHRYTQTIPAGQIGNDQPLTSISESWSAPSLGGVVLRSTRDDPRSGKSTTEVVRLDLSEPPLSTFQPPEGYKVTVEEMHQVPCQQPGHQ